MSDVVITQVPSPDGAGRDGEVTGTRFPQVRVALAGEVGSVVSLMSSVTQAMWQAGVPEAEMERYCADVVVLDVPRALAVTAQWVDLDVSA